MFLAGFNYTLFTFTASQKVHRQITYQLHEYIFPENTPFLG